MSLDRSLRQKEKNRVRRRLPDDPRRPNLCVSDGRWKVQLQGNRGLLFHLEPEAWMCATGKRRPALACGARRKKGLQGHARTWTEAESGSQGQNQDLFL